ncbi:mesenchyme-specific cell surface glycoprotein-like [Diadema antillarum]|uniref:mesenchyme-specific cell surface glycoprotein-like n=1 Tax=Diadema antillarum TaxID=105358 RepID=UPI003A88088F
MQLTAPILSVICALLACRAVRATYRLEPLSTIYIPYDYDNNDDGLYDIDAAAVEQSAYDSETGLLYAAGDKYVHILDLTNPSKPSIIFKHELTTRANDIELCGDYVAYVVEGATSQDNGYVVVHQKYSGYHWPEYRIIEVGSKPDMLKFSHTCDLIITANEGEAAEIGSQFVNPEGSISIVRDFTTIRPDVQTIDFTSFNAYASYYEWLGVRAPYKGQLNGDVYNTFSQNLEPEYIAIDEEDRYAYICLQENNAIAMVDIQSNAILELLPLGIKDWSNLDLDASDKDGKIATKSFDIYSLYQPDAIKLYRSQMTGRDYLITANEGDKFEYTLGSDDWDEVKRGEDLHDDGDLSDKISSDLDDEMNDDDKLGRLQFSKFDGLDDDGKVEYPHFFGARGVSVFLPGSQTMECVWDSGDEVERMMATYYPDVFNADTKPDEADKECPEDLMDSRSDNLGPECESIEVGTINGQDFAFFGVDRSAAILIYRIYDSYYGPTLSFESVYRAGGTKDTFDDLLGARNLGDLDPEDLKFVSSTDSATGIPLLIVTSTVSGTVSIYHIVDN